jgi:hypothetical protein
MSTVRFLPPTPSTGGLLRGGAALAICLLLSIAGYVPAASAAEGVCANNELHPITVSDCRAWELVTPSYSEGAPVQNLNGELAVAPEGTRMIATSAGVFADSEDGDLNFSSRLDGTAYELSRTATGWQPVALGPPESQYVDAGMYDASADLESTLWGLSTLTQPEGVSDLYIEQPRGTFTEIGPPTPSPTLTNVDRYSYLGASADLSHVLFSTEPGYRWPFDGTVGEAHTLYEYLGSGNSAPSLVGVSGGVGSTELVSQCGTLLGSGASGSVYNAVSASGARVFFTAVGKDDHECAGRQPPVDELLAREEGPSPGEVRTVAISEPTLAHCSASPSPPCADAHFEGASEDGSKVFFTSAQKLLSEAAEGTANLYEYDFDAATGENLVLASAGGTSAEVQGVARISEDGSHVYFVAKGVLSTTANSAGALAAQGEDNLYVYERDAQFPAGRTSFIAMLSPADEADWARADDRPVLASQNGRYLVFTSQADLLDEGVASGVAQVYQYDAQTGTLVRASVGGFEVDSPLDGATLATEQADAFDSPTAAVGLSAPEDGAVFFASPRVMTSRAGNNPANALGEPVPNVYEYREGAVGLISPGVSSMAEGSDVRLLGSDPAGVDVFFTTADRLSWQDTDTQEDIYDARVEGGFPEPATRPPCEAIDACRAPQSPPPPPLSPAAGTKPPGQAAHVGSGKRHEHSMVTHARPTKNATAAQVSPTERASADSESESFGIAAFTMQALSSGGPPVAQAGAHPYSLTTSFDFTTAGEGVSEHPVEDVKDVVLDLPMGLAVDALIAPTCSLYELQLAGEETHCPSASRVGTLGLRLAGEVEKGEEAALYDIAPEAGYPLEFGALYHGHPILIYGSVVRAGSGYGVRLAVPGVSGAGVIGASLTLFGNPAQRDGDSAGGTPMLTNPLACTSGPLTAKLEVDTWQNPGQYHALETVAYQDVEGCEKLSFQPVLEVASDGSVTETPTGYDLQINLPQAEDPLGLTPSELARASVTLPVGVSLSPSGTDGLVGCAATGPEGIDIGSAEVGAAGQDLGDPEASELALDGLYHTAPGHCPETATVGAVEIVTPLLDHPLEGRMFLARPGCGDGGGCSGASAEDGQLLGLYVEASGSGVILKLAGRMSLDQETGQVTISFDELPQFPIKTLMLYMDGSDRALLVSPQTCGVASANSDLSPWSSPWTPDVESSSSFSVNLGIGGEACPNTLPFEPRLNAGVTTPTAGSFSPLTLRISRTQGQQYLARFSVQLPSGLEWMLSSVPLCGEPQAAQGTCPSDSEIGAIQVAVGAGGDPLWPTGRVYLTEGYKGQPFGLSVVVPALAGPFNLGTVVVRAAIGVAAGTGALRISVDPLPQLLDGIPLRIRTIEVAIDRPEFVLNPTVCASRQIAATIEGAEGASLDASEPFATLGCQSPPPASSQTGAPSVTSPTPIVGGVEPTATLKPATKVGKRKRRKKHGRDRHARRKAKVKRKRHRKHKE